MGTLLNHMGHSYHLISAMDIVLLVAGVAVAALGAYAVTTFVNRAKKANTTTSK